MWEFCKRCNKEMLEYTPAFLDEPYLQELCEECIDLLNVELIKLKKVYLADKNRIIESYTKRVFNN